MRLIISNRIYVKMICTFIAFALFSVPCMVLASGPPQGEEQIRYGRGVLYNKEGLKIIFTEINMWENEFVYRRFGQISKTTIAKEDVKKVQIVKGSKAVPFAIAGGLASVAGFIIGFELTADDDVEYNQTVKYAVMGLVGALGIALGAAQGSKISSYKTIYDVKEMGILGSGVNILVFKDGEMTRIGLNYSF